MQYQASIKLVKQSKVGDRCRRHPEGSFSIATTLRCWEEATYFPGLLHFTLDTYLIILSVKQRGIKYHFLSLWYDSTRDWTQIDRAISEPSTHLPSGLVENSYNFKLKTFSFGWWWVELKRQKREARSRGLNQLLKSKLGENWYCQ